MFIVGIDPSLSSTGVCVYDTDAQSTYAVQIDGHHKDCHLGERIERIACHVVNAVVESKLVDACDPIEVFIEEPSGRLMGEAQDLRTLFWAIVRWLEQAEWLEATIYKVAQGTLKKWLTGKGNGKPEDKALAVLENLKPLIPEDKLVGPGTGRGLMCYKDLYDAIGLAALGACYLTGEGTKAKQEAAKAVTAL